MVLILCRGQVGVNGPIFMTPSRESLLRRRGGRGGGAGGAACLPLPPGSGEIREGGLRGAIALPGETLLITSLIGFSPARGWKHTERYTASIYCPRRGCCSPDALAWRTLDWTLQSAAHLHADRLPEVWLPSRTGKCRVVGSASEQSRADQSRTEQGRVG